MQMVLSFTTNRNFENYNYLNGELNIHHDIFGISDDFFTFAPYFKKSLRSSKINNIIYKEDSVVVSTKNSVYIFEQIKKNSIDSFKKLDDCEQFLSGLFENFCSKGDVDFTEKLAHNDTFSERFDTIKFLGSHILDSIETKDYELYLLSIEDGLLKVINKHELFQISNIKTLDFRNLTIESKAKVLNKIGL